MNYASMCRPTQAQGNPHAGDWKFWENSIFTPAWPGHHCMESLRNFQLTFWTIKILRCQVMPTVSVTEKWGNTNFCKLNWENKFSPPGVGQVWTVRSSQGIKTFVETLRDSWSDLHYFYLKKTYKRFFNKLQLRHKFFLNVPYQDPGQDTFMKNVNCYRW